MYQYKKKSEFMESYLISSHYDLVTPDGEITDIKEISPTLYEANLHIKNIFPAFLGFAIDPKSVFFNIKSTLAQLGLNALATDIELDKKKLYSFVKIELHAISSLAKQMLPLLSKGALIGKLFAQDERRKVRDPIYLTRMFGRCDRKSNPLLSLGSHKGKDELILEKKDGFMVAYITPKKGALVYDDSISGFLPTLEKILHHKKFASRVLLQLHQKWVEDLPLIVKPDEILLAKTAPLHIRTVFAKVKEDLLPSGFHHTSANVLQPDTLASGDVYEFFGTSDTTLTEIPLEFYTLEPHREFVFFEDRDQLQSHLDNPNALFKAFETAPKPRTQLASVFVVKGKQLENLTSSDWIAKNPQKKELPGIHHPMRQTLLIDKYIGEQASYPFLKAIEDGLITSEGILLTRHFPSPLLKKLLINDLVQQKLKGIYFQYPSRSNDDFFSHEDRAFLADLAKFAIPVYWVDRVSNKILQYTVKPKKDTGMFVPLKLMETFQKATFFGVYGSNLLEGNFEQELEKLLSGVLSLRDNVTHPLLHENTPLALVTGGGPGAMEVGNRVAQKLKILSCANIVDFRAKQGIVNEQQINPHVDAKMTFRLDRLVERQAEFHLDFPIFLIGGIGTDFEFALEEVRRKVGSCDSNPILLFGTPEYWREKITSRYQCNLKTGTIEGSKWVSNCFYCIQTAEQGLEVYKKFFKGTLPIGKNGPFYEDGFCIV